MPRTSPLAQSARRAFTLVELLTVLGILAIVIAIIIPAMNLARRAAKNSDSLNTLTNLSAAISMYKNDKSRYPGYFSPRELGAVVNKNTFGFDTMSNIMLDLIGGVAPATASGPTVLDIGPSAATIKVDLVAFGGTQQDKNGAQVRNYFVPDAKKMVVMSSATQRFAGNQNNLLPSLVDAFGQPILAWAQDETPSGGVFAEEDLAAAGVNGAKFYWAQNAAFLKGVTALGKLAENQNFAPGNGAGGSLLAFDANPANRLQTMYALLGKAAAPDDAFAAPNYRPAEARGPVILHAAGADGVFVGNRDRGGKAGVVTYVPNQDKFNGPLFDDQIMAAGH